MYHFFFLVLLRQDRRGKFHSLQIKKKRKEGSPASPTWHYYDTDLPISWSHPPFSFHLPFFHSFFLVVGLFCFFFFLTFYRLVGDLERWSTCELIKEGNYSEWFDLAFQIIWCRQARGTCAVWWATENTFQSEKDVDVDVCARGTMCLCMCVFVSLHICKSMPSSKCVRRYKTAEKRGNVSFH